MKGRVSKTKLLDLFVSTDIKFLKSIKRDETGSVSAMFGLTVPVLILAIGVTVDASMMMNNQNVIQNTADTIGLNASIFVQNNNRPPSSNEEGLMNEQWYSEEDLELGIEFPTNSTTRFKVTYDDVNQQAVVEAKTVFKTAFGRAFGRNTLSFQTDAIVKYPTREQTPASIFLVLDNSGSMAFDDLALPFRGAARPANAKSRISGMKSSIKTFSSYLNDKIEENSEKSETRFLRMGMTSFSTNTLSYRTVSPFWGVFSDRQINAMTANGGTNPSQSLSLARRWMANETQIHQAEREDADPLKYVVVMTDGANSSSYIDSLSLQYCTQMKQNGVEIFTIGYALEPGYFYTGTWGRGNPWLRNYYISPATNLRAERFLESCASSPDNFILAENATALTAAFDRIGEVIVEDSIRISN